MNKTINTIAMSIVILFLVTLAGASIFNTGEGWGTFIDLKNGETSEYLKNFDSYKDITWVNDSAKIASTTLSMRWDGIMVFDTATQTEMFTYNPGFSIYEVHFSPSGSYLLLASWFDEDFVVVDALTGEEIIRGKGPQSNVYKLSTMWLTNDSLISFGEDRQFEITEIP